MTLKPSVGDPATLEWFKSSYSTEDGPSCVEVATTPGTIHVRDSKNTQGPRLTFPPAAWSGFVTYASQS